MLTHIYQYTKCNLLLYRVQAKSSKCWNLWPAAVLPLPLLPLTAPSHTGATTLPPLPFYSFHSSSLPSALPKLEKKKKKVPPGFLALKGQKHTGFGRAPPPPPIPWALVTDREGRRQDGQGKGRKEAQGAEVWKKEKRCGEWKCCMGHFYKAALTAAHTEDGMCSSEWSKQRKWPWTKGWSGGEGGHGYHVKWWNTIQVFPGNRWEVLLKYWLFPPESRLYVKSYDIVIRTIT